MGEAQLLSAAAALTLAALLTSAAIAQGPVYRERWGFMHLQHRRAEVVRELAGREASEVNAIAALLGQPHVGVPFVPVAQALAKLRGVAADDAFVLRATVGAYVLPEVCDPVADVEECRDVQLSLFLPYSVPLPGKVSFDVTVLRADGSVLSRDLIEHQCEHDDLRMARTGMPIRCKEVPDGSYRLRVATLIDGAPPDATSPRLEWPFHVLRGYQRRAEAVAAGVAVRQAELSPPLRAALTGLGDAVHRAYTGEAFAVASDAVNDLLAAERALANLEAKRPLLDGFARELRIAVPAADGATLQLVLRRAAATGPRPLVVIVPGTPAYDLTGRRPNAPATTDPRWLAAAMPDFGGADDWHVAWLESPGGGRDYARSLLDVLPTLRELVAVGDSKPVLVCEREAAAIAALRCEQLRPQLSGLVLVGGGAMPRPAMDVAAALPIRLARVTGAAANTALQSMLAYAEAARSDGKTAPDVAWLVDEQLPWIGALERAAPAVRQFAAQCFAR